VTTLVRLDDPATNRITIPTFKASTAEPRILGVAVTGNFRSGN
jgi:hypothetical protein